MHAITSVIDKGLITCTVITGVDYIATFPSGVGLPVAIALSGISLLFSFTTGSTKKSP